MEYLLDLPSASCITVWWDEDRVASKMIYAVPCDAFAGARAELFGNITGFKCAAAALEGDGSALVLHCQWGNSFDATTIPSAQMHDDAESEKYHFGENILLFDVRKGS